MTYQRSVSHDRSSGRTGDACRLHSSGDCANASNCWYGNTPLATRRSNRYRKSRLSFRQTYSFPSLNAFTSVSWICNPRFTTWRISNSGLVPPVQTGTMYGVAEWRNHPARVVRPSASAGQVVQHKGLLRRQSPVGSNRTEAQVAAIAINVTDSILKSANPPPSWSCIRRVQELHGSSKSSLHISHGRANNPATKPRMYPERDLKKTRTPAHKKTGELAPVAILITDCEVVLLSNNRPPVLRRHTVIAAADRKKKSAAVTLGVASRSARKLLIPTLDTANVKIDYYLR